MTSDDFQECGNTLNAWLESYNFAWMVIKITDVPSELLLFSFQPLYVHSYIIL
jgi:hypothetical protein